MAKKLLKQRLEFPVEEKVETMDRSAIIQGQNIVELTVGFSRNRNDRSYRECGYNPRPKYC